MRVERAILDTNVLISAALQSKGPSGACVDWARRNAVRLIFSVETWAEFVTRLHRSKFDRYLPPGARELLIAELDGVRESVTIQNLPMGCRDPDDDRILETAVAGGAQVIVTGDQDLLVTGEVGGVAILTPRGFLEAVGA